MSSITTASYWLNRAASLEQLGGWSKEFHFRLFDVRLSTGSKQVSGSHASCALAGWLFPLRSVFRTSAWSGSQLHLTSFNPTEPEPEGPPGRSQHTRVTESLMSGPQSFKTPRPQELQQPQSVTYFDYISRTHFFSTIFILLFVLFAV